MLEKCTYTNVEKRRSHGEDGDGDGARGYVRPLNTWYVMRSNLVMISRLPGYPLATRMSSTRVCPRVCVSD